MADETSLSSTRPRCGLVRRPTSLFQFSSFMMPRSRPSRQKRRSRRRWLRCQLSLEGLETRRLLATLNVTSTSDAVDLNPGDGICEISAGGPCTLRAAIQEANALANSGGPDTINIPAGTYTLSLPGIDDQQSLTGDLDISQDVLLQGAGSAVTIIDGGGIDRVIDIVRGTVTINGVTVSGGLIDVDDDPVEGSGGGIRNEGDLTIADSTITGNVAPFGAAVGNYNGTLRISRSIITGNGDDTTMRGGGIANYANYDPATLELTDTTVSNNRADIGGGINNRSYDSVATATISRSTISGNSATSGGGISNRSVFYYSDNVASNLTIRGSTISGNTADSSGGGVHNQADTDASAVVNITGSTITGGTAVTGDGGGIVNVASSGASIAIESVIIAGNTAGGTGPDLAADQVVSSFSLIQTAAGHSVASGSGGNIVGQDPLLGPLADNGGITATHLPADNSPAIDQGSNPDALTSDQRGSAFARTVDNVNINNAADGTDMGSVEIGQEAATHDFGDAPESITVGGRLRRYPTQLASDGARHQVSENGPKLGGLAPDAEPDGMPTATATGDDLVGFDDEDAFGSASLSLTPGQPLTGLSIGHDGGASGALLSAWIDLNLDGDWDDFGEQILADVAVAAGASSTPLDNITLASNTPSGTTFIRVRLSTQSGLSPRGDAIDGEVEDFAATIGPPPPQFADLSLAQVVSDPNPQLGQDVTFTVTLANDGPDPATNVEVTDFLPFDLIFTRSTVSQGEYDDLDGIWLVGNLGVGASAVLTITATVDSTDPITNTAEVTASDQTDPDSTPGNGISGEDDQFSLAVGTCLTSGPLHVGLNQLTYSCASPGSFSAFVRGSQRGQRTFSQYGMTVDIADAQEVSIAIADAGGIAVGFFHLTEEELGQTVLVQAFEMVPDQKKSNTLSLDADTQMLRASTIGSGAAALDVDVLPAVIDAAISYWQATGISAAEVALLRSSRVRVSDLAGDVVGRSVGGTVVLDRDAAGHGWFVDATPRSSGEFRFDPSSATYVADIAAASGRLDLVTVMVHEFGHLLGLPDLDDSHHVMHHQLDVGIRRLPTTDTNPENSLDINGDRVVSALDALIVINRLDRDRRSDLPEPSVWIGANDGSSFHLDANGDFRVSAVDALLIINHLGRSPTASRIAQSPDALLVADLPTWDSSAYESSRDEFFARLF